MKTKLLLIVFIISTFAFSATSNEDTTKIQIENLQKENENLKKEIEIIKVKSESSSVMIDNVDSMYQNNFDRLAVLFTIIGAIVTFVLPHYLKKEQQKIIELKEKELNASNTKKINEVLKDFNEKLSESEKKYKEELKKETENLNNTIIEKTKELEQKITKSNYSLNSKIYLGTTSLHQTNENYDDYTNSYLHYLYNCYKAKDSDLEEIIRMSDLLINFIEHKNVFIIESSINIINFFINEYNFKQKKLNPNKLNPFITLKNTVKLEEED